MLFVEIEKPENQTLASWFSELRSWFDLNRCEPTVFVRVGRRLDRLIYRISFEDAASAKQFTQRFSHYAAQVRRATSFERAQLREASSTTEAAE